MHFNALAKKQHLQKILLPLPRPSSLLAAHFSIESDNFEITMREAQSRKAFQNKVACAHSVKRYTMV